MIARKAIRFAASAVGPARRGGDPPSDMFLFPSLPLIFSSLLSLPFPLRTPITHALCPCRLTPSVLLFAWAAALPAHSPPSYHIWTWLRRRPPARQPAAV